MLHVKKPEIKRRVRSRLRSPALNVRASRKRPTRDDRIVATTFNVLDVDYFSTLVVEVSAHVIDET